MSSPFWSFDPYILFYPILLLICFMFLLAPIYSLHKSNSIIFTKTFDNIIDLLFPKLNFYAFGFMKLLKIMFFLFSFVNLVSLFPYVISPLGHITISFSLAMMMWMGVVFYQLHYFYKYKMKHLTPSGSPLWLVAFMVLIELVSQMIRPITLGIRLAANLTAGHLILALLSMANIYVGCWPLLSFFFLEILVSFVQPFVFCLLIFLYFMES